MSYSRTEEEALIGAFFGDRNTGFFIDIGASDGITASNTRALWERGWTGVFIEPSLDSFLKLAANYHGCERATLLNVAVGTKSALNPFFIHPEMSEWASLSSDWVATWKTKPIVQHVLTVRLDQVTSLAVPDFLSIDTEGLDADIIESLPATYCPELILAEIDKGDAETRIQACLSSRGYKRIWSTIGNAAWSFRPEVC